MYLGFFPQTAANVWFLQLTGSRVSTNMEKGAWLTFKAINHGCFMCHLVLCAMLEIYYTTTAALMNSVLRVTLQKTHCKIEKNMQGELKTPYNINKCHFPVHANGAVLAENNNVYSRSRALNPLTFIFLTAAVISLMSLAWFITFLHISLTVLLHSIYSHLMHSASNVLSYSWFLHLFNPTLWLLS